MNKQPKRRKNKDNPYTLRKIGEKHIIEFVDSCQIKQIIEVSEKIYNVFDQFELDDIRDLHIFERHIEHCEVYEETLYHRSFNKPLKLETIVFNKITFDYINKMIETLSYVQQKRLKLYYFEEKTLKDIAIIEGTTHQAISKSIKNSVNKIKNLIKK